MTSAAESYDLGQAVAHMTFQAQALGLHVHQTAVSRSGCAAMFKTSCGPRTRCSRDGQAQRQCTGSVTRPSSATDARCSLRGSTRTVYPKGPVVARARRPSKRCRPAS